MTAGVGSDAGLGFTFTPAEGALQFEHSSWRAVMVAFDDNGGTGKSNVEAWADPVPRLVDPSKISTGDPGSRPSTLTLTLPAHNGGTTTGTGTGGGGGAGNPAGQLGV